MSSVNDDNEDLKPSTTPGYRPSGPAKTADEYAKLDAEDESLARWKASLGITPGQGSSAASGPKLTVLTLELHSPTLSTPLVFSMDDAAKMADIKKNPITIKEGVDYTVRITFKVNHSIVTGVQYIQLVKRGGFKVGKIEQMLGSFGPHPEGKPHEGKFEEESPAGMVARSGTYHARSRVVDDDGAVYADWEWSFKLAKEW
ncbi:E set domain-containing protein [Rhizopogon salebrosus TDB-379]|nr:E set domain-containing protein [Rhizopogon salebrosus TDB-379]